MNRNIIALAAVTALAACGNPTSNDANLAAGDNAMVAPGDTFGNAAAVSNGALANSAANIAASPPSATPTNAASYITMAGAGDMFEIESSKALIAKTADADAKRFANMMIDAHTQSTAKVKAAAQEAGLTVSPPTLDPMQQQMLDEIKAAPADRVDAVYYADQARAHNAALALHQHYAADGDTPALKKAAGEIVPVVQQHIAELKKLSTK